MTVDLELAATKLASENPVELEPLLAKDGPGIVKDAITKWRSRGRIAHVLIVRQREAPTDYLPIFEQRRYNATTDLLLVMAPNLVWTARGWGLSAQTIQSLHYLTSGATTAADRISAALDALGNASLPSSSTATPPSTSTSSLSSPSSSSNTGLIVGGSVGAALLLGGVGLIVWRRNKLERESSAAFNDACGFAEKAYAEVVLAAEQLEGRAAADLQLRASELKKRLDETISEGKKDTRTRSDPVTLGRIKQFESELAALRSTTLQRAKAERMRLAFADTELAIPVQESSESGAEKKRSQ